ncbi:MAG: hypothetical protein V8Q30_06570 [Acutalibacteraceae bacterium]
MNFSRNYSAWWKPSSTGRPWNSWPLTSSGKVMMTSSGFLPEEDLHA